MQDDIHIAGVLSRHITHVLAMPATPSQIADLQRHAEAFGCPELIALHGPQTEAHLDYLDLTVITNQRRNFSPMQ